MTGPYRSMDEGSGNPIWYPSLEVHSISNTHSKLNDKILGSRQKRQFSIA